MKKMMFFMLFSLVATIFVVYIYIFAVSEKTKTYYFPQMELHLKIYKPPFNKYGYVIFSKDSIFSFSENIDFVKIYKSEVSMVDFIFNPADSNKVYIVDLSNNAQINRVNFAMEKIHREDTAFFESTIFEGLHIQRLKPTYFKVFVEGFLESVFIADTTNIGTLQKVEPIG